MPSNKGLEPTKAELAKMEMDDINEQAEEVGYLTPREYAKLRGMQPQLVYYYIRTGVVKDERCKCGRRVIHVQSTDDALATQARARGKQLDTRDDSARGSQA